MIRQLYLAIGVIMLAVLWLNVKFIPEDFIAVDILDPEEPEAVGWKRKSSRKAKDYLSTYATSAISMPNEFCTDEPILLHVFVISAANRYLNRLTIRNSWGKVDAFNYDKFKLLHLKAKENYLNINHPNWKRFIYNEDELIDETPVDAKFRVKLTFVLGAPSDKNDFDSLANEIQMYDDIIVEDFIDNYANMTLKTLTMLKWATSVCKTNAEFIAKVDDDEFVVLPNLIHLLLGGTLPLYEKLKYYYNHKTVRISDEANRLPKKGLLAGHVWLLAIPKRNPKHKYYTPYYLYNRIFYPSYLGGFMYFMSIDVAKKLYEGAQTTPLFHMEDVYFTGMVAKKQNISLTRLHLLATTPVDNICQLRGMISEQGRNIIESMSLMHQLFVHQNNEECELMDESWVKFLYKFCYLAFEPWLSMYNNFKEVRRNGKVYY